MLDAGCGPAGVFIHLHPLEKVVALDPLLDRYEAELAIFDRADYPSVDFLHQALETHISGGLFDAIYCFNAINHVADWNRALDVLTAAAAPGAKMILTSDVHRHRWLKPIFQLLPGDLLHPQQHGPEAYRSALTNRGWHIDQELTLKREAIFDYTAWIVTRT